MKKWFCSSDEGLGASVKMLIYTAGYAIAKNNKDLAARCLPVANGILDTLVNDGENGAINAMLKEAMQELVEHASDDVVIQGAVLAAIDSLGIDLSAAEPPKLKNEAIKDLLKSFVAGVETAMK